MVPEKLRARSRRRLVFQKVFGQNLPAMWTIDYLSAHPFHQLPNFAMRNGTTPKKKKWKEAVKKRIGDIAPGGEARATASRFYQTLPVFATGDNASGLMSSSFPQQY